MGNGCYQDYHIEYAEINGTFLLASESLLVEFAAKKNDNRQVGWGEKGTQSYYVCQDLAGSEYPMIQQCSESSRSFQDEMEVKM